MSKSIKLSCVNCKVLTKIQDLNINQVCTSCVEKATEKETFTNH